MKALFIAFNQAFNQDVIKILEFHGQRGFTRWTDVGGRGSDTGTPHFGDHAWPEMNQAVMAFVPDGGTAKKIIAALGRLDASAPDLGLRVFSWDADSPARAEVD